MESEAVRVQFACSSRAFQAILLIQITKLKKDKNYYIGIIWEEIKKRDKKSNFTVQKFTRLQNFIALRNFATLVKLERAFCNFFVFLLLVLTL